MFKLRLGVFRHPIFMTYRNVYCGILTLYECGLRYVNLIITSILLGSLLMPREILRLRVFQSGIVVKGVCTLRSGSHPSRVPFDLLQWHQQYRTVSVISFRKSLQ